MSESAAPPGASDRARGSIVLPVAYGGALLFHLLFLKSLVLRLAPAELAFVAAASCAFAAAILPSVTLSATFADSARRFGTADPAWTRRLDRCFVAVAIGAALLGVALASVPNAGHLLHWPALALALAPWIGLGHALARTTTAAVAGVARVRWFALLTVAEPALRLALSLALVAPFGAARGALVACALAPLVVIVVARALLPRAPEDAAPPPLRHAFGGAPRTLATLALAGMLSFADVVIANVRMSGEDAGLYAGMSAIARFPEFIAAPFALVLLVRSRVRVLARASPLPELRSILTTTALLLAACVALASWFREDFLRMLLDDGWYDSAPGLLPPLLLAHALIALAQMLLFFGIAVGTVGLPVVPFALLAAQTGLLAERGTTPAAAAWVQVGVGGFALGFATLVVVVPILFTRGRGRLPRRPHSDDGPAAPV